MKIKIKNGRYNEVLCAVNICLFLCFVTRRSLKRKKHSVRKWKVLHFLVICCKQFTIEFYTMRDFLQYFFTITTLQFFFLPKNKWEFTYTVFIYHFDLEFPPLFYLSLYFDIFHFSCFFFGWRITKWLTCKI